MTMMKLTASALALTAVSATGALAQSRDQVQIAGSSTVLPYASIVAEAFGENFDFPTPVVESGGSSAGLKRFCEGVGENTIDIANASRAGNSGLRSGHQARHPRSVRRKGHHRWLRGHRRDGNLCRSEG